MCPHKSGGKRVSQTSEVTLKKQEKDAEMGRFFASEYLREPGAQEYWVIKALEKVQPVLKQRGEKSNGPAFYCNKTEEGLHHGSGLFSNMLYGFNYAPWTGPPRKGKGVDIHKAIGKLPKPKRGFTLPGHRYTGPYNPFDEQLRFDPNTGEILEFYVKPSKKKQKNRCNRCPA